MVIFKKKEKQKTHHLATKAPNAPASDYFTAAKHWYYDRYQIQQVIANRWQLAFWLQLGLSISLLLFLMMLLPLKSWEPIVIQRNTLTGEVWVDPTRSHYLPNNSAEIESNLVRYVVARETYTLMDATYRYRQVMFSSSTEIAKGYADSINPYHSQSVAHQLSSNGTRVVRVEDVVFLDAEETAPLHHHSDKTAPKLAKVDFVTTDTEGDTTTQKYWVATIGWDYLGTPNNKEAAWMNWNGFTVTYYRVDQRNL